jgi:hypothetical protein
MVSFYFLGNQTKGTPEKQTQKQPTITISKAHKIRQTTHEL